MFSAKARIVHTLAFRDHVVLVIATQLYHVGWKLLETVCKERAWLGFRRTWQKQAAS